MAGSAQQRRAWQGPALLSFGFRPFFLFGAAWSAIAMALWVAALSGWDGPPTRFSAVDWHAHEMLFGYLPAAIAGFLLTAVPNWTGRYPIMGWPLAALFAVWLAGRIAVLFSAALPALMAAAVDLAFLFALGLAIAREIVAGKNWRNLKVLALIGALAFANVIYHSQAIEGGYAAGGSGARLATAVAIMLIVVIGGRIVPSFTRNWLAKQAPAARAPASFGRFDAMAMAISLVALAAWTLVPGHGLTALACVLAGVLNAARLARWNGWAAGREALVWILHVGFGFVPLGFLLIAAAWAFPGTIDPRVAQHAFMAGAIGVMTLAVMTRASLGHLGRDLRATPAIVVVYCCAIAAALMRVATGVTGSPDWLLWGAAGFWIAAFIGFVAVYGPMLTAPRRAGLVDR